MYNPVPIGMFFGLSILFLLLAVDYQRRGRFSVISTVSTYAKGKQRGNVWLGLISSVIPLVTVIFPEDVRITTKQRLDWGGIETLNSYQFLALKIALSIVFVAGGMLIGSLLGLQLIWFFMLAVIGYMAPDFWLQGCIKKRQKSISKDLPDFSMMLSTCLVAGVDIGGALQETAQWFGGELGKEVKKTWQKIQTGDRLSDAMNDMASRCGVDELTQLIQTISQATRYGTKISEAVLRHAEQMRVMRRYAAEKVGAEANVKVIVPMLIFFLGPIAVMMIYPALTNLGKILEH